MYYAILANGMNYLFSGHMIWENEDPLSIDLGDGRKATASKQFTEPFHWLTNPVKTAMNKAGILPRLAFELGQNQKWLSPRGHAPPIWEEGESPVIESAKHVGSKFVPIAGQQIYEQGAAGLSGFLGHPIYGMTDAERERKKEEAAEKRRETRRSR